MKSPNLKTVLVSLLFVSLIVNALVSYKLRSTQSDLRYLKERSENTEHFLLFLHRAKTAQLENQIHSLTNGTTKGN